MESALKQLLLPLLLILFFFSPTVLSSVFQDEATLEVVQRALPDPQAELERIFAVHAPHPGPLWRAMNVQHRLYAAVLFAAFEEYLAEVAFNDDDEESEEGEEALGVGDRLLVLLKDHHLLPEELGGGDFGRHRRRPAASMRFTELRDAWNDYLNGALLVPTDDQGVVVNISKPNRDQILLVPQLLQPLLCTAKNEHDQEAQRWQLYGDLERRFMDVYVSNYPVKIRGRKWRFFEAKGGNPKRALRTAVLRALFWMIVVRPFQAVVAEHPELFPSIDPNELLPGVSIVDADDGEREDDDDDVGEELGPSLDPQGQVGEREGCGRANPVPVTVFSPPPPVPPPIPVLPENLPLQQLQPSNPQHPQPQLVLLPVYLHQPAQGPAAAPPGNQQQVYHFRFPEQTQGDPQQQQMIPHLIPGPPPPPPQNISPSPPPPNQLQLAQAPAQPSCSSSSVATLSTAQTSQPQNQPQPQFQGTCSASVPVPALIASTAQGGALSEETAARLILQLSQRGGAQNSSSPDGGSPPPKKHKPDRSPKDPDK